MDDDANGGSECLRNRLDHHDSTGSRYGDSLSYSTNTGKLTMISMRRFGISCMSLLRRIIGTKMEFLSVNLYLRAILARMTVEAYALEPCGIVRLHWPISEILRESAFSKIANSIV
jgi:hypothetical protein